MMLVLDWRSEFKQLREDSLQASEEAVAHPLPMDLNNDCIVNTTDLLLLLGGFGTFCE